MFNTGQRVVCVDDQFDPWVYDLYTALPNKGSTYTVRDVSPGKSNPQFSVDADARVAMTAYDYDILVRLVELVNPLDPQTSPPQELGFRGERFAPQVEAEEEAELALAVGWGNEG